MKQHYEKYILEGLFHQFFPEKEILTYIFCDGGIENSNFLIETRNGENIYLKIFESSRNEDDVVSSEIKIMIELRKNGINVPHVFHDKKDRMNIINGPDGKLVVLFEYIEGVKYSDSLLSLEKMFITGKNIAELHLQLGQLATKYSVPETHIFDLKYIFSTEQLQDIRPDYLDISFLTMIWSDVNSVKEKFLSLPYQIIHDDLHSDNIIYKNGSEPFFIDFSDLVFSPCIQDIAISLVSWCFRKFWYPEGMTEYLRGYESICFLSVDEKECLFACIEARLLNIVLTPYLDPGIGDFESLKEYILENYHALQRFHAFGREEFMKYIP